MGKRTPKRVRKMNKLEELMSNLNERNERISKAKKVRSLLQMQKGLIKRKQSLTDFQEPVLFLVRRDGKMETYEKATSGKFIFDHSTGKPRFIELRPSDQITFDYGDKKVRGYIAHEDRPFAGWDEPIIDSETVMLGYEKTKATDLKYQSKIEDLKRKGKLTWVWIILALLGGFGLMSVLVPTSFWDRLFKTGQYAIQNNVTNTTQGLIPLIMLKLKKGKSKI